MRRYGVIVPDYNISDGLTPQIMLAYVQGQNQWERVAEPAPGILVGRSLAGGGITELWFVSALGAAHDTGLRAEAWDWSAVTRSGRG